MLLRVLRVSLIGLLADFQCAAQRTCQVSTTRDAVDRLGGNNQPGKDNPRRFRQLCVDHHPFRHPRQG